MKKSRPFLKYTLIFLIFLLIGLLPIEISNKRLLFSGLHNDGYTQHLVFLKDYIIDIKNFLFHGVSFPLYKFDVGLGADTINTYTYYSLFDIFNIIAIILPIKYIEEAYYIMVMLRLYLSGIFIIILAKKYFNVKSEQALICTAISYVFCYTVIFSGFKHAMFINGPLLLPLIIMGILNILNGKNPYLLIFSVCYTIYAQFYFFVYITFAAEIFLIVKLICEKKKFWPNFIKVNLYYLLGVLLSAAIIFTTLYSLVNTDRVESKKLVLKDLFNISSLFFTLLIPISSSKYTVSIGNIILMIAFCSSFYNKKVDKSLKYSFLVIFILSFSSLVTFVINGMSYSNNRHLFSLALFVSLTIGQYIENYEPLKEDQYQKIFKIFVMAIQVILITLIGYVITYLFDNIFVEILVYLLLALSIYLIYKKMKKVTFKKHFNFNKEKWVKSIVLSQLIVTIVVASIYSVTFATKDKYTSYYNNPKIYDEVLKENEYYRIEENQYNNGLSYFANDAIMHEYNGTYLYNTMTSSSVLKIIDYFGVINSNKSVGYEGFNSRLALNTISSVKYLFLKEGEKLTIPYGYEYLTTVEDNEKIHIYENKNYLPYGFTYDNYVLDNDLDELDYVDKENVLLESLILEEEIDGLNKKSYYKEDNLEKPNLILDGVEINNGEIKVNKKGGTIKFYVKNVENSNVYLFLEGFETDPHIYRKNIRVSTNEAYLIDCISGKGTQFYDEVYEKAFNLGYYENEEELEVTISLDVGKYKFTNIFYKIKEISNEEEKINKLKENVISNLKFNDRGFTGTIDLDKEKMIFFSTPYSSNFKAYINGKETKIYRANIGYMAIKGEIGINNIEFRYTTPYFKEGLYVGAGALIVTILTIPFYILSKRKRKQENNKND